MNVTPAWVSIPISEVRQIEYLKGNPTGTALLVVVIVLAGAGIALGLSGGLGPHLGNIDFGILKRR